VPSKQEHLEQARRDKAFADSVDRERFPEWVPVAWFYCALHLVDALLAQTLPAQQAHPTNHIRRVQLLSTTGAWRDDPTLGERYALDTLSRHGRYACRPDSVAFTPDRLEEVYRDDFLPLVEQLEALLA
jgi:hypothetical protein